MLGLIIILGVSVLTVLLFVMAAAFSSLNLADPHEALGLPQGSVRALIALLLIIIWAIISIFVFRFVAFGVGGPNGKASDDGIKLAQQLFTTMSTLVVAVSAFYFGSSTAKARGALAPAHPQPVLLKIVPDTGKQGQADLPLTIIGKNFLHVPKSVQLVLGSDVILAKSVALHNTEVALISCTITIKDDQTPGQWDLLILSDDGNKYLLPKAFTVTAQ
jgi:hypothetical protein